MWPPVPGAGRPLDNVSWQGGGLAPSRVPALARTGGADALETEARLAAGQVLAAGAEGPAFDLSAVRIHADAEAGALTRTMRAAAVTVGDDVYFAAGRFRPDTRPGRALIAHELTHVQQQRRDGTLGPQLSPDPPAQQPQTAGGPAQQPQSPAAGTLQLPWSDGDLSLFEVTSSGIWFLVAVPMAKETDIRALIPKLCAQILRDNKRILAPAFRVMTCLIADVREVSSEFVRWQGAPTIFLKLTNATTETVAHEMGHATLEAFAAPAASGGPTAAQAAADQEIRLRFASLFVRLSQTTGGLDMVDPEQWAPGKWGKEHPSKDTDEFFASAKAAYQTDRKALQASIDRAANTDNAVGPLGKEMMDLLDAAYGNAAMPAQALTPAQQKAAQQWLPHGPDYDTDLETIAVTHVRPVSWLIHPGTRPPLPPTPQATKPSSVPATKQQ
jgi:hypothetical protein